jgi:hypothetical protein
MADIFGKFGSGFAETIVGTPQDDNIWPLGGFDVVDGGGGIDTVYVDAPVAKFEVLNLFGTYYVDTVSGASAVQDQTTLKNVERLVFSDTKLALDLGTTQAGGQSALLLGAVLGHNAVTAQPVLVGALLQLFAAGLTLHDLSAFVMKLDIWQALAGGTSNAQVATYLLTTVNGHAPSAAELGSAVSALAASPGEFLYNLALSSANQTQVNLVGLQQHGLVFM